ncbi:ImmA/IrrE family metallo-endopeptidase [Desulfallas thermosapovorans]|uniref:Uncharacterized protein DUF955 n=1 Tax=Desulfallas thermosapovorans DSM 6562 TaxID=1121431 RepID=A0A5S4ZMZ5_9FIRM|nr:ImmA/IrrE family metallo-endopeptidase [Desulfallas thermosapovorans]TYO92292.1 uncharacterized protein DUF955 [Desulfallas thermosapovorans DSM 6562]
MILDKDYVPVISGKDMDREAAKFLLKYCPRALVEPMPVPVEEIAELEMNLDIDYVHIAEDGSTLGMMIFTGGNVQLYHQETGRYTWQHYEAGTMLVESSLTEAGNRGRERFTIAHEMVHWDRHRIRFLMLSPRNGQLAGACRCPRERVCRPRTPEEWMEWQADNLAAAILMPAEMFKRKALEFRAMYDAGDLFDGCSFSEILGEDITRQAIINDLAQFFQVSRQAAQIRGVRLKVL